MAKIVAEFDTKEKTLVVKMDGEVVPDLNQVCFYSGGEGKGGVELHKAKMDEDEKTVVYTRLYADEMIRVIPVKQPTLSEEIADLIKASVFPDQVKIKR